MKNKGELKKELKEICDILYIAQEDLKIVGYFYSYEPNTDSAFIKEINAYFCFTRITSWKNVVLEIYKLFHSAEDYNIFTLLNSPSLKGKFSGFLPTENIKTGFTHFLLGLRLCGRLLKYDRIRVRKDVMFAWLF